MSEWSVRAANSTTYTPFGSFYEGQCIETVANPWKFTGQWHDVEIDQYHLRARQYDPAMMRFTSRDPIFGVSQEPLTLHKYLYCLNAPVNRVDLSGEIPTPIVGAIIGGYAMRGAAMLATAIAVDINNDDLFEFGLFLEKHVAIGMAVGFAAGTPGGQIAIKAAAAKAFEAGTVMLGMAYVVGQAAVHQAIYNPSGTTAFLTSLFGDPRAPSCLHGFYGALGHEGGKWLVDDD